MKTTQIAFWEGISFSFKGPTALFALQRDNFAIWQFKNCQIAEGPSSQMESIKAAVFNPTHTAAKSFTKSSCLSITPNPQLIYVIKFPAQSYVLTYLEMLTFWKYLQTIYQDSSTSVAFTFFFYY